MDLARPEPLDRGALRQALAPGQPVAGGARPRPLAAEDPPDASPGGSEGAGRLRQKGLARAIAEAAQAHPDRQIALWFMDEARVGQKGRTGHRWWLRGERPRGLCDRRFEWAYIYGAVRPATGESFALVLPEVSTETMSLFLGQFAATLAPHAQAVVVLDQAGWHGARHLRVPENLTLVPLPPCSPELNPMEWVWLYLREHHFSHRVLDSYDAIVSACCAAWNNRFFQLSRQT
jgi:transposase